MFAQHALYNVVGALNKIRNLNDKLNAKVVDKVNDTQELLMINDYMKESNEYMLKKCLQERISDVASWQWVLTDLANRLDESIQSLKHESKALHIIVQRIDGEIRQYTSYTKAGGLRPLVDSVEEAIIQELSFLQQEKQRFASMIPQIEKQRVGIEKTKSRIENDALNKCQAMSIDEACYRRDESRQENIKKRKKKCMSLIRWEKRCSSLKETGIAAMKHAIMTRQMDVGTTLGEKVQQKKYERCNALPPSKPKTTMIRTERVQLSISAQAYGTKVDSALRRRLHSNVMKLQDLDWQRNEVIRDFDSLENELVETERSIHDTLERRKVVQGRLAGRNFRPSKETTVDQVTVQLRAELAKLRKFTNELRTNRENIISLQEHLRSALQNIDCCAEDIMYVVKMDQERLQARSEHKYAADDSKINTASTNQPHCDTERHINYPLEAIKEENENDL